MKVLIVKNYAPDRQFSMLAFADMLERGLTQYGIEIAVAEPPVTFGKGQNTMSGLGKWRGYIDKYLGAVSALKNAERSFQPDLVHICDHSNAMYLKMFSAKTLLTCNDLLAIRVWLGEIPGQSKRFLGGKQQQWIFNSIQRADRIACISDKTHQDLVRLIPESAARAHVIPMGLNYNYQPIDAAEIARRIQAHGEIQTLAGTPLEGPWIIHVGNDSWYKNRLGVAKMWQEANRSLEQPHGIVFVGEPPSEEMQMLLADAGKQAAFLPDVSNELLQALYCKAKCLLFPSLAEGYGWPPIEAQACGCPVVVSDIEPLRSNCRGAMLIDPNNNRQAGEQVAALLSDSARLDSMSRKGLENVQRFTAESMINSYVQCYRELSAS